MAFAQESSSFSLSWPIVMIDRFPSGYDNKSMVFLQQVISHRWYLALFQNPLILIPLNKSFYAGYTTNWSTELESCPVIFSFEPNSIDFI